MLGLIACLISGCSHYSGSSYGGRYQLEIACDASPPNQPGCYERDDKSIAELLKEFFKKR